MADDDAHVVWMYTPSFALSVLASVLYGLLFLCIFYLTVLKYRAWYFTCVVVGAGVEVAGYALRCYSIKQPTLVVRASSPFPSPSPPPFLYLLTTSRAGTLRRLALPRRARARPPRRG
jgi:hypothetical protein